MLLADQPAAAGLSEMDQLSGEETPRAVIPAVLRRMGASAVKNRKQFKINRNNADPRRRGLLCWKGSHWAFPQRSKRILVWKPKSRVGWRLDYHLMRKPD